MIGHIKLFIDIGKTNWLWFLIILVFVSTISHPVQAQNPIGPRSFYMADPSAHVWKDGKLYIYGSRDESPNYFCSWGHDVALTTDLKTWTIQQNVITSKGAGDQIPYSDERLFAPDCQYKNGLYYLYYCLSGKGDIEGVATSPSPIGPFTNGTRIDLYGNNQIDPCVFMDDDGQAYYIWGQFSVKVAKLKPNMKEIDPATIKSDIITEKQHFFHEGVYMVKRNGIYYLVYTDISRGGIPSCIGYSTARSPYGPFKYRGVIIDNSHCDPGNWNDHGSLVEFKKRWYVVYHRATHNSYSMRRTCLEPIHFNADGSINEVEMTTQGASAPLPATDKLDAERACLLLGNVYIQGIAADNEVLDGISNNDKVCYKYLDFTNKTDSVTIRVAPGKRPARIEVALDHFWSPAIAIIDVPAATEEGGYQSLTAKIASVSGIHALILRFYGQGENIFKVDWLEFE